MYASWFKKIDTDNHDEVVDVLTYLGHNTTGNFEAATASFQAYSGVKVDGDFGPVTATALKSRYCACPDILPAGAPSKWGFNDLTVWHDMQSLSDLDEVELYMEALSMWSAVTPLTFTWWAQGNSAKVNIFEHARRIDGSGKILAWSELPPANAGRNVQLEQRFDTSESWPRNLLLPTMAHELGHALGLGHLQDPDALMYPYMNGTQKPAAPDIRAIQELYGSSGPDPKPPPPNNINIIGKYGSFVHEGYTYTLTQIREQP